MRLTKKQIESQYPNQWIGIANIVFNPKTGEIESADVIYTDKTASELGFLALNGEKIEPFFTTPDDTFQMGIAGGI